MPTLKARETARARCAPPWTLPSNQASTRVAKAPRRVPQSLTRRRTAVRLIEGLFGLAEARSNGLLKRQTQVRRRILFVSRDCSQVRVASIIAKTRRVLRPTEIEPGAGIVRVTGRELAIGGDRRIHVAKDERPNGRQAHPVVSRQPRFVGHECGDPEQILAGSVLIVKFRVCFGEPGECQCVLREDGHRLLESAASTLVRAFTNLFCAASVPAFSLPRARRQSNLSSRPVTYC